MSARDLKAANEADAAYLRGVEDERRRDPLRAELVAEMLGALRDADRAMRFAIRRLSLAGALSDLDAMEMCKDAGARARAVIGRVEES